MNGDFVAGLLLVPAVLVGLALLWLGWRSLKFLLSKLHVALLSSWTPNKDTVKTRLPVLERALAGAPKLYILELFGWSIVFARSYEDDSHVADSDVMSTAEFYDFERADAPVIDPNWASKRGEDTDEPAQEPLPWVFGEK